MDVSVSETIDQKTYLKNLGGGFSLNPPPGSAYVPPKFLENLIILCFEKRYPEKILLLA